MSQVSAKAIASKTSLVLLPFLSIVAPAADAFAQVVSAEGVTTVDFVGDRIDITGGYNTSDNTNLFHSFDQFDVSDGQTANFVIAPTVQNVIGKVNSSSASTIDGTLQVSGSSASLYLMNPAGVLIGPNAQLNLSGGFTATTATSLEFNGGYANVLGASDYSELTGDPTAFHFATDQPGAIVNLGDLSVSQEQSLSLMGGTVVNDGKLNAPEGTVAIAATEGNNTIRISQENQLLSLEIEAGAFPTDTGGAITAESISQMLTGGSSTSATALTTQANGTVQLGQTPIDESGGNAVISGSLSANSAIGSNIAYIAATKDITLTELINNELYFPARASLTFAADADSNGVGRFEMNQGGAIGTDGGTINISGAGITAGHLRTDLTSNNSSSGGDIRLISSREVSVNAISTNSYSFSNNAGDGGDIRVEANGGDIFVSDRIKTWSSAAGNNAGRGGDVDLEAEGSITIAGTSSVGISSGSYAERNNAGAGGRITLTSRAGNIVAESGLYTQSRADRNNTAAGGEIAISALAGEVSVGDLLSSSAANNNAGNGGDISIEARVIQAESINTNAGSDAGTINLSGSEQIVVRGGLSAISNDGGSDADITLTSNFINLLGENSSSVDGKSVWFKPSDIDTDIAIGGQNEVPGLNILQRDIDTIGSVDEIIIGLTDGAGTINIEPSVVNEANARAPVSIIGGKTLAGPNQSDNRFSLTGSGQGSLLGINLEFSNIENLIGGDLTNRFLIEPGASLEDFDRISGGTGISAISYENSPGSVTVDLSAVEVEDISQIVGNSGGSTLRGGTGDNFWTILSENSGVINGLVFAGFENLLGGAGQNSFVIEAGGSVESIVGGGNDVISYNYSSESTVSVFGDRATGISSFSDIERIESGDRNISLIGSDADDTFFITSDRTASFNSITVSDIQSIEGREGADTLDYSTYSDRVLINAGDQTATGVPQFSSVETIVGSAYEDVIEGSNNADIFEVLDNSNVRTLGMTFFDFEVLEGKEGADEITLYGLPIGGDSEGIYWSFDGEQNSVLSFEFDGFERLVGSTGSDTFDINGENFSSDLTIRGGSETGNRIISNSRDSTWRIGDADANLPGKDRGELRQGNETLLAFSEIQNIQNDSLDSQGHTVSFLNYSSQITESIDSGTADLTLIGNDINIGEDSSANNIGGGISGEGRLTIRPQDSWVSIELGETDTRGPALNITEGEISAIQDGFSEIVIGGAEQVGEIRLLGDVRFSNGVVLRSQGNIDIEDNELFTSRGNILLDTSGNISGGNITALDGSVTLSALGNINAGTIIARGEQGISVISETGSMTATGSIDSSGSVNGGDVEISAKTDISVESITTEGGQNSGDVTIRSLQGGITARGITTANGNINNGVSPRRAGDVDLESWGGISVAFIDARSRGGGNTEATQIDIKTDEDFSATGSIENAETRIFEGGSSTAASISTVGAKAGNINISYGNPDRAATLFQVGADTGNGTAFRLETSPTNTIVSGEIFTSYYSQGNIRLLNRGYFSTETADVPATRVITTVANIPEIRQIAVTDDSEADEIYQQIEERNDQAFEDYWGTTSRDRNRKTVSLAAAQNALGEIQRSTTVNPALVYVYFVPDAELEASVSIRTDDEARSSDQLEVMLITQDGIPVRQRQWGITRQQVDEASYALRQQVTSQFSIPRQYLPPAQQLYRWIVAPIAETLQAQNVDSLGFVMDTGLRTLPISALHDGDRYLVENYSLGLLPSLSLAQIGSASYHQNNFSETRVLAMGASRFRDQPDLPAVEAEVSLIAEGLGEGDAFLNEDFVLETLQSQIDKEDYGIIHLATHATFESGNLENSYIQLWDEKLPLEKLNDLRLDQEDLSMIILSACNTAVGDRSAEYGFAGLAVGAGAQSALASLWPVNDEGTLGFMTQFYDRLAEATVPTEALQHAQIRLISGDVGIRDGEIYGLNDEVLADLPALRESGRWDFSHPFYWSAFTMIGNPW